MDFDLQLFMERKCARYFSYPVYSTTRERGAGLLPCYKEQAGKKIAGLKSFPKKIPFL
jgi:hypothetical protein